MGRQSDEQRFTAIFLANKGHVFAYARRRVGDGSAQDVVAETFLAAWRNFDDVPDEALPWLYRAASFHVSNLRRSWSRSPREALDDSIADPLVVDPGDAVAETDRWSAAFRQLSESDREVLRLVGWEAVGPRDAAFIIGCSLATFKVRLHRARRRFLQLLERPDGDELADAVHLQPFSPDAPARDLHIHAARVGEPTFLSSQGES